MTIKIITLYEAIVKSLREDSDLKEMLSDIYVQIPDSPAIPYAYLHLQDFERINTFEKLSLRVHMVCYGFSWGLEDIINISDRTKSVLSDFFGAHPEYKYIDKGYKIKPTSRRVFQSASSFEILAQDSI